MICWEVWKTLFYLFFTFFLTFFPPTLFSLNYQPLWSLVAAPCEGYKLMSVKWLHLGTWESAGENAINSTLRNEKAPVQLFFVGAGQINTPQQSRRAQRLLDPSASVWRLGFFFFFFVWSNHRSFHFSRTQAGEQVQHIYIQQGANTPYLRPHVKKGFLIIWRKRVGVQDWKFLIDLWSGWTPVHQHPYCGCISDL